MSIESQILDELKARFPRMESVSADRVNDGTALRVKTVLKAKLGGEIEHTETFAAPINMEKVIARLGGWWFNRQQRLADVA